MMMKPHFILLAVVAMTFIILGVPPSFAQENSMIKTTSKGSLDIWLEPIVSNSTSVQYNVRFLNPGTETLHEHQDYDLRILKEGQVIFSAAQQTGQSLIHNVEGTIFVPYNFEQAGEYEVEIQILGLGFGPTLIPTDENAVFPVRVVPEFPAGMVGLMAAVYGSTVAVTRKLRVS